DDGFLGAGVDQLGIVVVAAGVVVPGAVVEETTRLHADGAAVVARAAVVLRAAVDEGALPGVRPHVHAEAVRGVAAGQAAAAEHRIGAAAGEAQRRVADRQAIVALHAVGETQVKPVGVAL